MLREATPRRGFLTSLIQCLALTFVLSLSVAELSVARPSLPIATKDPGVSKAWKAWSAELRRLCPSHHVDWLCGDCYDDLLSGFDRNLPPGTLLKVLAISNYSHRCPMEKAGFDCEMGVELKAYQTLGLLKQFAAFGCDQVRCEAAALCSKSPSNTVQH